MTVTVSPPRRAVRSPKETERVTPPQGKKTTLRATSPKRGQGISSRLISARESFDTKIIAMDQEYARKIGLLMEHRRRLREIMRGTLRIPPAEYGEEGLKDLPFSDVDARRALLGRRCQEECGRGSTPPPPVSRTLPAPPMLAKVADSSQVEEDKEKKKRKKKKKRSGTGGPNKRSGSRAVPGACPETGNKCGVWEE